MNDYQARLRELELTLAELGTRQAAVIAMLAAAAVLCLVLGVRGLRHRSPVWWTALPAAVGVAAIPRFRRLRRQATEAWRLKGYYRRGLQRISGDWPGNGASGEEFLDSGHPYARDLGVFGEGSLFELLCVARTAIGRRGLANYLLAPASPEEAISRQAAVRELSLRGKLREHVALLGDFEAAESRRETFTDWLDSPAVRFHPVLRVAAAVSSAAVLSAVLAGAAGLLSWRDTGLAILPFLAFQSIAGLVCRERVRRMMESLRSAALETTMLRQGLQLLEQQHFHAAKLVELTERVRGSSRSVRALEWLLRGMHERNKEWFYQASLLLMAATQLSMGVERWRQRHGTALRSWIDAWGEFEALNALGNYAAENPAHAFPAIEPGAICFDAAALGHPLMQSEKCVRNDVRLDARTRFYVISGSNMSGKSSLLRAMGLNAVLALAGAPVRAERLRLSPLKVCASIGVVDSQLNGQSKFLAEVERVRLAIESAAAGNVLFLIDEIFSGTNSRDRRAASDAVVRTLVERGAIGALSTHDMALTEIAEAADLHGLNVHLGARDGADPMSFDYRLKAGITTETNALAIARMAGVPV
jgi:hypothetical protein